MKPLTLSFLQVLTLKPSVPSNPGQGSGASFHRSGSSNLSCVRGPPRLRLHNSGERSSEMTQLDPWGDSAPQWLLRGSQGGLRAGARALVAGCSPALSALSQALRITSLRPGTTPKHRQVDVLTTEPRSLYPEWTRALLGAQYRRRALATGLPSSPRGKFEAGFATLYPPLLPPLPSGPPDTPGRVQGQRRERDTAGPSKP